MGSVPTPEVELGDAGRAGWRAKNDVRAGKKLRSDPLSGLRASGGDRGCCAVCGVSLPPRHKGTKERLVQGGCWTRQDGGVSRGAGMALLGKPAVAPNQAAEAPGEVCVVGGNG